MLLPSPARPQAFAPRVQRAPAPAADSAAGAFCDVARWGGRLFILYDAACFWTGASPAAPGAGGDAARDPAWARQDFVRAGPKGNAPALAGGWFTRCANGLWLGNREGALAWRFDTATGVWSAWPSGAGAMAAAGTGGKLYALSADHVLRASRNAGATWEAIALPDEVRRGTFFDDILAEGDHLVLRARDPAQALPAARSFDGGATWSFLPAHALPVPAQGRLYAFGDTALAVYRPGAESLSLPAPQARAAFADSDGLLFAWADSGLFVLDAGAAVAAASTGGSPVPWLPAADSAALRGWSAGRGILYRLVGGTLAWFDGQPVPADAARRRALPRGGRGKSGFWFDPADPGGFRLEIAGFRCDPVGRPISAHR